MADKESILTVLRTVRTSDVSDALDSMGLQQRYIMDPLMRPLYFGIRFAGIAYTAEYDFIDKPLSPMSYDEFDQRQYAPGPEGLWKEIGSGGGKDEVMVIDAKRSQAGILGSNNTLFGRKAGIAGWVIDGTCRDSYECILQKTPAFCTVRSPQHPMGRIVAVSVQKPITCAGVEVHPGDFVLADDDGVAVIPQQHAEEAVQRAKWIQEKDRPGRRAGYEALGLPLDETVS